MYISYLTNTALISYFTTHREIFGDNQMPNFSMECFHLIQQQSDQSKISS